MARALQGVFPGGGQTGISSLAGVARRDSPSPAPSPVMGPQRSRQAAFPPNSPTVFCGGRGLFPWKQRAPEGKPAGKFSLSSL